ncbi:hypothetical protein [Psychrobacter sp. AOP7-B1-24]|uniref:hypothetical protein n=1 Tax=Psychrobacter sp. AOP7-B1-24 TaxID=3457645 RepID=UPI00402BE939
MKKILLSLALSLGAVSVTPAMAAAPAFSASQMAQVKVPDLSFKQVMRAFYNGQMTRAFVNAEEVGSLPYIGLGYEENGEQTVAVMHPIVDYLNSTGEPRYLVIIEKLEIYEDSGNLVSGHAMGADADLYTFKRLKGGQYQLVSKSSTDLQLSGSWGRIQLDVSSLKTGLQPIGQNVVGSIFSNGYVSTGVVETRWEVLHLPEDDYINSYLLGDAGSSNAGNYEETSPLHYDYESTYQVMPDGNKYYPIKLTFKGDKPTDDYERIEPVNYSKIVKFDPVKKEYQ